MENHIYKIDILIIKREGYRLKITTPELKEDSKLIFDSVNQNWHCDGKLIEKNDIYNIEKRKGIWFEQDHHKFFSKISIFEETEYYFEITKKNNKERIVNNSIKQEKIKEDNNIENEKNEKRRNELFAIFFESHEKWMINQNNYALENEDKFLILIKEIDKNTKWSINFKGYIGRLKLRKDLIGDDFNDIEVIPKKLSKKNYFTMLDGLNTFISQIFFKDKSPTQIPATKDFLPSEITKTKLYDCATFLLLKSILEELPFYFYGLTNRLNSKFHYKDELKKAYEVKDTSNINYIRTISNSSNLMLLNNLNSNKNALYSINDHLCTFKELYIFSKYLSFDTPENRFVKFVLKLLYNELEKEEIKNLFSEVEKFKKKSKTEEYFSDITEMIHFLERKDIKNMQVIPYNSQILQKNSYYRRFLQYYIWLQNPTAFNINNIFLIDIKPMHLLYELYCLYKMKDALDSLVEEEKNMIYFPEEISKRFELKENPNAIKFREISWIKFNYQNNNGELISLIFKPENYSLFKKREGSILNSYSNKQNINKPDFILVKWKNNQIDKYENKNSMVILDAKYRINSSDLWQKMHFYKDALNVIGAIFINPFISEEDLSYSGKILTPYGELTGMEPPNKEALQYGFISGVNLLGLKENENDPNLFKRIFKIIFKNYFNN